MIVIHEMTEKIEAYLTAKGWELANDIVSVDYYDSSNYYKHAGYKGFFFKTEEALWLSMNAYSTKGSS